MIRIGSLYLRDMETQDDVMALAQLLTVHWPFKARRQGHEGIGLATKLLAGMQHYHDAIADFENWEGNHGFQCVKMVCSLDHPGEVCGAIRWQMTDNHCFIHNLVLHPDHRKGFNYRHTKALLAYEVFELLELEGAIFRVAKNADAVEADIERGEFGVLKSSQFERVAGMRQTDYSQHPELVHE